MLNAEMIKEARKLIEDPAHWCSHALVRGKNGQMLINPRDPEANQWCAIGALMKTSGLGYADLYMINPRLISLNDGPGHAAVLEEFDNMISAG